MTFVLFVLIYYVRKSCPKLHCPHVYNYSRKVKTVNFDTIAAISTPMGEGAIAIVRLSGDEAVQIADRVFQSPSGKRLAEEQSHTIHYGHLIDPESNETIEEVMVSLMRAPKTFTREDEIGRAHV